MGNFICIDLKSFYASVECVARGLDPFKTNLIVADPGRSKGTVCLAITPAMKMLGVKKASRLHELPPGIEYITAIPRMKLYVDYSARIYNIYLRFAAAEDIHVYSIDECFIDAGKYLKLYGIDAVEFAKRLMNAVYEDTGITATAGVGTNLYLAKIAMDIVAKHVESHIGVLDEKTYRKLLWDHKPITDFWMIGKGIKGRLERYGMRTMGDIARASITSQDMLFRVFGMDAELLIDHAWGAEPCRMEDIKNYRTSTRSVSCSQVLMRNYSFEEARIIAREMADMLSLELVKKGLITESVTMGISYDHRFGMPWSGGTVNYGNPTNNTRRLIMGIESLYERIADRAVGIRRISLSANHALPEGYMQYDMFTSPDALDKDRSIQMAVISLKERYGKNAILRGCNLLECSTMIERNRQIGGHRA